MNNFIAYFYKMNIKEIIYHKKYYSFIYNNYLYHLHIIDNNINVNNMININKKLIHHTLVSEIIINKDGNYISNFNNQNFILMKIYVNVNKKISLEDINYLADSLYILDLNINWGILWSKKIDYLEDLINENGKKYPLIVDSFNYFVGLAENAIAYYNDIIIPKNYKYVISHKRININDTSLELCNPLNIIFDYKVRDIAEYIKNAFFLNNNNIINELNNYLKKNNLSVTDIKILISRLLYPSFYFDMYEDILIDNKSEKIIIPIIDRLPSYEKYLANIINYFKKWYDVSDIHWLEKKS